MMRRFFLLVFWCVLSNVSSSDVWDEEFEDSFDSRLLSAGYEYTGGSGGSNVPPPLTPPPTPAPTSKSTNEHRTLIIVLASVSIFCLLLAFLPRISRGSAPVHPIRSAELSTMRGSNPSAKSEERSAMLSAELHLC